MTLIGSRIFVPRMSGNRTNSGKEGRAYRMEAPGTRRRRAVRERCAHHPSGTDSTRLTTTGMMPSTAWWLVNCQIWSRFSSIHRVFTSSPREFP